LSVLTQGSAGTPLTGTGAGALLGVVVLALGCSVGSEEYTADAETGSTHALVAIERSVAVDAPDAPRANALAGFVRVPAMVDPGSVMNLVGLGLELPAPGHCTALSRSNSSTPLSQLGHVEFLDAGDVALSAARSATSLAPRAFPTVTDLVSGVVYTTRDRSADALPAGQSYTLKTSGGLNVPQLSVEADAPAVLEAVTVGGLPLSELSALASSRPLDITWGPGDARDLVYVELASSQDGASTLCVFRDDAGSGSIPADSFGHVGDGHFSIHRVRSREFSLPGINRGELRFDFELVAAISFSR
jgi:hypothetical protein